MQAHVRRTGEAPPVNANSSGGTLPKERKDPVKHVVPKLADRADAHRGCGELPRVEVDMDRKHEELTAAERSYLEHAERTKGQGQTLAEYCRQLGLSPRVLYSARRQLKIKGLLAQAPRRQRASGKPGQFITVSVAQSAQPDLPLEFPGFCGHGR